MKIFVYWNKRDNNSKKMYKFLKSGSWIDQVQKNHEVIKAFMFDLFDINTCTIKDNEGNDVIIRDAMLQADLLMFFTHGDVDRILKFNFCDESALKKFTFVDCDCSDILSEKAVISICCSSAQELGKQCVKKDRTPYYIGFEEPIVYNDESERRKPLKEIMYKAYSNGFDKGFSYALNNNLTANKIIHILKCTLNQSITSEILSSKDRSLCKYSVGEQFFSQGIESLVCLGDGQQVVFKAS